MQKIQTVFKAIWAALVAIASGPVVAPLLDLLQSRAVLTLVAGAVAYIFLPDVAKGHLSSARVDTLSDFLFGGILLLVGRFSWEGILAAKASLPTTPDGYVKGIATEILTPTTATATVTTPGGVVTAVAPVAPKAPEPEPIPPTG